MLLLLLSCSPPSLPDGQWLAGDVHVHSSIGSNDTDGLGTPDALGPAMAQAGLDWLVLTDHSNSTGSMGCADVEDCPNQGPEGTAGDWPDTVFWGSEISPVFALGAPSEPTGHVGCIARDGDSFPGLNAFVDRPVGAITGSDAIEQCKDAGGFAVLNHPFGPAPWVAFDWTSNSYAAMEVYNGSARFDPSDAIALAQWEVDLSEGRRPVPVGGSDSHRWGLTDPADLFNPPLGWPLTWVHVRQGEGPIDALMAGRVVIAEPGSHLRIVAEGSRQTVGPGESIEGPVTLRITASATVGDRVLQWIKIGEGVQGAWSVDAEAMTRTVEVDEGIYYARIFPAGAPGIAEGGVAITGAIFVD